MNMDKMDKLQEPLHQSQPSGSDEQEATAEAAKGRPGTEPVRGTPVFLSVKQLDALLATTALPTLPPDAVSNTTEVKHEDAGIEASTGRADSLVASMSTVLPEGSEKVKSVQDSAPGTQTTPDTNTFIQPPDLVRQSYQGNVGAFHVGNAPAFHDVSVHSHSSSSLDAPDQTINDVAGKLVVAKPVHDNDVENPEDLPQAEGFDMERAAKLEAERINVFRTYALLVAIAFLVLVMIFLAVFIPRNQQTDAPVKIETSAPTSSPSQVPTSAPTSIQQSSLSLLPESTVSAILNEPESPQSRAFQWLMDDVNVSDLTHARIKQRFALATFFYATKGDEWVFSANWLNYSVHECEWEMKPDFGEKGVLSALYDGYLAEMFPPTEPNATACDENGLFNHLWLDQNNLVGHIPLELYMLTTLKTLSFGGNRLPGPISTHIGQMTSLEGWATRLLGITGTIPR
jgi:hypothetical protein